jgi:hypothetical protein
MVCVDLNEPLPRLLRLRGSLARSLPDGDVDNADAKGLAESYARLRIATRELAVALDLDAGEFDAQFPTSAGEPTVGTRLTHTLRNLEVAKTAASLLRQLGGYVEGLIEALVLEQNITMEQVKAAREAARQPPGFK